MRPRDPWLCQGDVFAEVPLPTSILKPGSLTFGTGKGPALLLNDDCILDKRSAGNPQIKRLNFAPMRVMADQQYHEGKEASLRNGEVNPPDPVYVDLGAEGEAVALLSETFSLPAGYFGLVASQDPSDQVDDYRLAIEKAYRDTRTHSMDPTEVRLLQEKLALFWTGAILEPVCAMCWELCMETAGSWRHLDGSADHTVELTRSYAFLVARGSA